MKLQAVGPPERGSLSVVYSCPECGYEIAMLTNAYETQVVQSLGVRIGPGTSDAASSTSGRLRAEGASASLAGASAEAGGASVAGEQRTPAIEYGSESPTTIAWDDAAAERMKKIPAFVRGMVITAVEESCRKNGLDRVTVEELERIRARMPTPKMVG